MFWSHRRYTEKWKAGSETATHPCPTHRGLPRERTWITTMSPRDASLHSLVCAGFYWVWTKAPRSLSTSVTPHPPPILSHLFTPPPPCTPGNHWCFYFLHNFAFLECYTAEIIKDEEYISDWFISNMHLSLLRGLHGLDAHFLLVLNSMLLSEWATFPSPFTYWGTSWFLLFGQLWMACS